MGDPRFVSGGWESAEHWDFECDWPPGFLTAYEVARWDWSTTSPTAWVTRAVMDGIVERQGHLRQPPEREPDQRAAFAEQRWWIGGVDNPVLAAEFDELSWDGDCVVVDWMDTGVIRVYDDGHYEPEEVAGSYVVEPDRDGLYQLGAYGLVWAWRPVADDSNVVHAVRSGSDRYIDEVSRRLVHRVENGQVGFYAAVAARRGIADGQSRARQTLETSFGMPQNLRTPPRMTL